jgi:hypothetical protein
MNNIYLAGLLARFLFMPSHHAKRVTVAKCKQIPLLRMKLTATGIAPVSHRTSLLTPDTGDQTLQMYRVVLKDPEEFYFPAAVLKFTMRPTK